MQEVRQESQAASTVAKESGPHAAQTSKDESVLDVVGLFGTCGNSKWRDEPQRELAKAGIASFNPVVANWTPECAKAEAEHLQRDRALLFVVTGETEGYGSLAETGWAEVAARSDGRKAFFVIDDYKNGDSPVDPKHPANRARALVRAHAQRNGVDIYPSVGVAMKKLVAFIKEQEPHNN